jgi:purine-binding chemotaxis protein CheW
VVFDVALTELFRVPDYIEGVTNLRGRIFTVVNFSKFVNLPLSAETFNEDRKYIVLQIKSGKEAILSVAKIKEVLWLNPSDFHDLPDTIDEREKKYLENIIKTEKNPIPVIDMNKFLNDECWNQI